MIERNDRRIQKYLTPYRYPEPVLTGSGIEGAFDEKGVDIPFVFWHNNQFYMLYTGFDGTGYQSALAVSDDLLHWTHKGVILKRDLSSERWDRIGGSATWIVKDSNSLWEIPKLKKVDGKYIMVYHSYPNSGYEDGPAEIGLAWCSDEELLDWHFSEKPIFSWKDGEDWEAGGLYKACLLYENNQWYLFYNAKNKEARWIEQTGMAVSKDLKDFQRCRENPILKIGKNSWDERFVSDPYIVYDGDMWINFYFGLGNVDADGKPLLSAKGEPLLDENGKPSLMGYSHAQEGLALSKDFIHWEKVREPIIPFGEPGRIDSGHAHKASMVYYEGTLYHFYCGTRPVQEGDVTSLYEEFRTICLATSKAIKNEME
ncbi:hypothetical protein LJC58_01225 [Lachnospiraceae bacterium OttesenSCG-928-D06]|nr:hypothetical protein [Lachnospiraceae bacterium OttesenSCG-928-D06]